MDTVLFNVIDPQGQVIYLTVRCYTEHLLIEHPDMDDVDEIAKAVKSPDYITEDAVDPERNIYYRTYQRHPQKLMVKVVVEQGEVITAYRVNRIKRGEQVLWQR